MPKPDRSARVIFNLIHVNEYIEHYLLKKKYIIKEAFILMQSRCYFTSIDFKHAYLSVSIEPGHIDVTYGLRGWVKHTRVPCCNKD